MAAMQESAGALAPHVDLEAPCGSPASQDFNACSARCKSSDLKSEGRFSAEEGEILATHMKVMRSREICLLAIVALLVVAMFGTSMVAIKVTQEMHVQHGHLTDTHGETVLTRTELGSIEGVHFPEARRLNATYDQVEGFARAGDEIFAGDMQIRKAYFRRTAARYTAGQTEWVVPLPDRTVRTVHIMGSSANSAWGSCGDCQGTVTWIAKCDEFTSEFTPGGPECNIEWYRNTREPSSVRRLGDVEAALLERSSRAPSSDESGLPLEESVERVLNSKVCA